ncbi:MAG: hypothetical protein ACFFD4_29835 [Candidatus Odinarchaeota archaeon]
MRMSPPYSLILNTGLARVTDFYRNSSIYHGAAKGPTSTYQPLLAGWRYLQSRGFIFQARWLVSSG